jgi:hypothetical protein
MFLHCLLLNRLELSQKLLLQLCCNPLLHLLKLIQMLGLNFFQQLLLFLFVLAFDLFQLHFEFGLNVQVFSSYSRLNLFLLLMLDFNQQLLLHTYLLTN